MSRRARSLAVLPVALVAACAVAPSPEPSETPPAAPTTSQIASPTAPMAATPTAVEPMGWHRIDIRGAAPAAREDHTWTVGPDGTTAYLFGGRDAGGRAFDDLWSYDLAANRWQRIDVDGPLARFGHSAAWVDGFGLVIFAGQSPASFYNDLWAYEPAHGRWRGLPADGAAPVARYGSCAAVGRDGRLWISHGFTSEGSRFADTRAYDFTTLAWTDETPAGERPIERCLHGCWWTDDGQLALYAGQTTGVPALGDLWHLTPGRRIGTNTWSELPVRHRWPSDRQLYASARWGSGTVIFGGGTLSGSYLDDSWLIADDGRATAFEGDVLPPARSGAELIADPAGGRLLLFGGRDADGVMDDLWELRLPDQPSGF